MKPESITFNAPIEVPTIRGSRRGGFFDIVYEDGQAPHLRWRSFEDWPLMVRQSTGEKGRLVRWLQNDVLSIPRYGKVTLTFEQCIATEEGTELYHQWDEDDWKPEDDSNC